MANISAIKLPNGTTYTLKDNGALQLTGGQVTGPVSFGDSVSIDEATLGDLVVNGSASFTNNLQANTINGVVVGNSPKFTDTITTATTTGSGNAVTAITASSGVLTVTKGTTFLTSHQDISGKADKSATVSTVAYDSTNKKITKTINGTTSDVVTVSTLKTALGSMPASDVYSWAKESTKPSYTASEVGAATSTHTHGNITNGGDITATAPTIASGDQIIINDHSASKITNGVTFDGSTTTTALTPKGTWESFSKFSGSYNDLTNKPTIPTVPSNVSAFTNDAGYITSADVPEGASAYTGTISAVSTSASSGTSNGFARGDHVHNITGTVVKSALGTGSGTTKFLREDGSWATPAYTTNTDAKLQVAAVTSGTTYYPIVGTGTTAATRQYDTTGLVYVGTTGTTSAVGSAKLTLGNSTASGTANNKQGQLIIYGSTAYAHTISGAPTAARALTLPDKAGTIALTSDIPTVSYPVTSVNSKTGAVSLTASDVGALASSTTYVSTITTTAGAHSAISSKSGAVSFNVPTKTSHLTNDSGYLTGITSSQVTTALGYTPYNSTNPNGYTSNTGTVTKVTAGTGLSIGTTAGGNFTTSGTINHSNSVTAQTTQAVYPIKIDAQGHISGYGSAVTSMPASDVSSWAKASSKPTYTASEVGAAASTHAHGNITSGGDITATAPTIANGDQIIINDNSASKITNGPTFDGSTTTKALTPKGTWETFLKSYTEKDPTVPSWAKASSKPSYTASEVGAVPTSRTINGKALSSNITLSASDVSALYEGTLSMSGLTAYSSRCVISAGGYFKIGKMVFVQLRATNSGSLGSNNTWGYIDGFPIPEANSAAISAYASQNYGNISAIINNSGRLVIATGGSALAANTDMYFAGWYMASS